MGLFDDLDVANAKNVSFIVPPGTYEAIVSNCETKLTKDGRKTGLNITYTITQEGQYKGRSIMEWQRVPKSSDLDILDPQARETALGYLKKRMLSLGVAEDKINSVEASELIGIPVAIGIRVKPSKTDPNEEQNQVTSVKVLDDSTSSSSTSSYTGAFS
jgi:hypothetical protein